MDDSDLVDEFLAQLERDYPGPMGMRLYSDVCMWARNIRACASLVSLSADGLPGVAEGLETIWATYVDVIDGERDAAAEADAAIASAIRKFLAPEPGSWWAVKELQHST